MKACFVGVSIKPPPFALSSRNKSSSCFGRPNELVSAVVAPLVFVVGEVNAVGDMLGPSISGLDRLLRIPTGAFGRHGSRWHVFGAARTCRAPGNSGGGALEWF